jgi:hypothetical protein
MKQIALVSGPVQGCGIYYWGINAYDILKHSKKYKFHFVTASSYPEFLAKTHGMDLIIYNWHSVTMPWCTTKVFAETLKPQFLIHGHTLNSELIDFTGIDKFITVDPSTNHGTKNFYSGYRPITYYDDIMYNRPNGVPKIGTSGIGHDGKNVNLILNLINDQFDEPVVFNIHWSVGEYVGVNRDGIEHRLNRLKSLAKPNVELNFTVERLTEYDNVKWLNNNDINLYMYNNYDLDGVSGSIDKALAAKKPIGVNTAGYFRHIISDQINIDKTKIKDIINSGITPVEKYYDMWNVKTFLEQYEGIFDDFFKRNHVKI